MFSEYWTTKIEVANCGNPLDELCTKWNWIIGTKCIALIDNTNLIGYRYQFGK